MHDPIAKINSAKSTVFCPVNRENLFRDNSFFHYSIWENDVKKNEPENYD